MPACVHYDIHTCMLVGMHACMCACMRLVIEHRTSGVLGKQFNTTILQPLCHIFTNSTVPHITVNQSTLILNPSLQSLVHESAMSVSMMQARDAASWATLDLQS